MSLLLDPSDSLAAETARESAADNLRQARTRANDACDQLARVNAAADRALRGLLAAEFAALDLGIRAGVRQGTADEHRRRKLATQVPRRPSSNGKSAPEQPEHGPSAALADPYVRPGPLHASRPNPARPG